DLRGHQIRPSRLRARLASRAARDRGRRVADQPDLRQRSRHVGRDRPACPDRRSHTRRGGRRHRDCDLQGQGRGHSRLAAAARRHPDPDGIPRADPYAGGSRSGRPPGRGRGEPEGEALAAEISTPAASAPYTPQAMKLNVREWGTGDRTAVLIHGITSDSGSWWRFGPDLAARGYHVLAPDLRGHGLSPRGEYGPEAWAGDLHE